MNALSDREFFTCLDAADPSQASLASLPANDAADLSLARQLLGMQAAPSSALTARVQGITLAAPRLPAISPVKRPQLVRRIALGLAALCLVVTLTLAISPTARAKLVEVIRSIGGVTFSETEEYPGGGDVQIAPGMTLSLEEAQATLPYPIRLPAWVPEGFTQDDTVTITFFDDQFTPVSIGWSRTTEDRQASVIGLTIEPLNATNVVGPESIKTVEINGQPAAFVHGGWNADTQTWDTRIGRVLMWKMGEQTYLLSGSPDVSDEDLLRIAESIP